MIFRKRKSKKAEPSFAKAASFADLRFAEGFGKARVASATKAESDGQSPPSFPPSLKQSVATP
ncbi:MAG: hypothetical protein COX90_00555 [Candidatus Nealsonbacteria bacterium CG_4_10_14_0_2_um_filter_38_17]|uniref:Uncharacterized protein n=1 Tax=Candidatus Nealsonbacteria bacterium CG_4_10_14_0_2_um_filter_38_17 TaxID=1974680 RepID=A0A2M7UZ12_9BACT|nr:MAG: hypothetical protein COX90_00555 [Candidatus Nealsonbacteria bacterium CG_4_10_14_0_2_um_filter_38_17]